MYTHEGYLHHARQFRRHEIDVNTVGGRKKAAVVLDMFAGVGTGALILKKLQIDMDKVCFVIVLG